MILLHNNNNKTIIQMDNNNELFMHAVILIYNFILTQFMEFVIESHSKYTNMY